MTEISADTSVMGFIHRNILPRVAPLQRSEPARTRNRVRSRTKARQNRERCLQNLRMQPTANEPGGSKFGDCARTQLSTRVMPTLLRPAFFARSVHAVAPDLIGATLLFGTVGGVIVEVEAYHHTDPAAHSLRGPTQRTAVLSGPPGFPYVYRSYGIHWCLNFVCEPEGSASAVLIRALEPITGIPVMRRRRGLQDERMLCSGPGKLGEALAITHAQNGLALDAPPFEILARTDDVDVAIGPRIGITKAVDHPWRYGLKG